LKYQLLKIELIWNGPAVHYRRAVFEDKVVSPHGQTDSRPLRIRPFFSAVVIRLLLSIGLSKYL
jgi:hypothetical protein